MKRTPINLVKVNRAKNERKTEEIKLLGQRQQIDNKLDNLRIQNELDDVMMCTGDLENMMVAFASDPQNMPTPDTELDLIMTKEEKLTMYEHIAEFFNISIEPNNTIVTFQHLINMVSLKIA